MNLQISLPKSSPNTDFEHKITVIPLYQNDGYSLVETERRKQFYDALQRKVRRAQKLTRKILANSIFLRVSLFTDRVN